MPSYKSILAAQSGAPARSSLAVRVPDEIMLYNQTRKRTAFEMVDPSEWMAQKSTTFNRYQMDFINDVGVGMTPYSERQLEAAYFASVYLFAAIRRVANLVSRAKVVAEIKRGNKWQRAGENMLINRIFAKDGAFIQSHMYLNYAIYGLAAAYKIKTRKAVIEENRGEPLYDYAKGAVAGLHVLDKPYYDLDEDVSGQGVRGLFVQQDSEYLKDRSRLERGEFVFFSDWNPRRPNRGMSMAAVAIHKAVANAAIGRWAAEYFTRGALPMLIISLANDDPTSMTDVDTLALKRRLEQELASGIESSLRSAFSSRQVKVDQIGIRADEVAAPELDKSALEGISATIGIERDLIVAPEGGTQERHEQMLMQAWNDTVIPFFEMHLLPSLNGDLGLPTGMRLVIDVSHINELDAMRDKKATTEKELFVGGVQRMNEARKRLNMPPDPDFGDWMWNGVDQIPISPAKLKAMDALISDKAFQQVIGAWDSFLIRRNKALKLLNMEPEPGDKDGYKFEVTPQVDQQGGAFGALRTLLDQKAVNNYLDDGLNISSQWTQPNEVTSATTNGSTNVNGGTVTIAPDVTGEQVVTSLTGFIPAPDPRTTEGQVGLPSEVVAGGESWVSVWMPNDPALVDIQNQLRAAHPELDYEDPAHFHVTLVYAPFVRDLDLPKITALMPKAIDGFELWAGPVMYMSPDFEDQTAVILRVDNSVALSALQGAVAKAYQAHGLELSPYSKSGEFKPHVTLARCPQPQAVFNVNLRAILRPQTVVVQKGEYETVHMIGWTPPPPPPPEPTPGLPPNEPDAEALLKSLLLERKRNTALINLWQKTGKPPAALADHIVKMVKECVGHEGVFAAALTCLENGWLDADAHPEDNPVKWYLKGHAVQDTPEKELAAWEKVALRNLPKARRFEVKALMPVVETEIRDELLVVNPHEKARIKAVFERVRAIDANPPGTLSEDELVEWVEQIEKLNDPELRKLIEEATDGKEAVKTGERSAERGRDIRPGSGESAASGGNAGIPGGDDAVGTGGGDLGGASG